MRICISSFLLHKDVLFLRMHFLHKTNRDYPVGFHGVIKLICNKTSFNISSVRKKRKESKMLDNRHYPVSPGSQDESQEYFSWDSGGRITGSRIRLRIIRGDLRTWMKTNRNLSAYFQNFVAIFPSFLVPWQTKVELKSESQLYRNQRGNLEKDHYKFEIIL